eukprot:403854-Rhodomonas_salina.2
MIYICNKPLTELWREQEACMLPHSFPLGDHADAATLSGPESSALSGIEASALSGSFARGIEVSASSAEAQGVMDALSHSSEPIVVA